MKVAWTRAIRFVATDGRNLRGEPILPATGFDVGTASAENGELQAKIIVGDDLYDSTGATYVSDEVATVKKLLGPLGAAEVPILRCVGLNYIKHSEYPTFWRINILSVDGKVASSQDELLGMKIG